MKKKWRVQGLSIATVIVSLLLSMMIAHNSGAAEYRHRYAADVQSILSARHSMQAAIDFVDAHPHVFPATEVEANEHQLSREQRMLVWQSWQYFLDHVLFLDTMGSMYAEVYLETTDKEKKAQPFLAAYACFLAQYRFAMDYIQRMENNLGMHVILNEDVPELGLDEGTYAKMKFRFLNVLRGAEFARLNVVYLYYKQGEKNSLQAAIEEDMAKIWRAGKGKGPELTAKNALKIVGDLGFTAWFPVQKNVSALMGEIKVWRPGVSLISSRQIEQMKKIIRPGDILLQRREWYATNVGIPGFWTHAAFYIGTPEERTRYFADPALQEWLMREGSKDGTLESLLKGKYPHEYQASVTPQEEKRLPRVLEAIAEGVSFTTLEHSASADSIVVLRPNLSHKDIIHAIIRAFHYIGRPYDFNFDFRTDSKLVCSELIYKAYESTGDSEGLSLPLSVVLERPLLSPNEIARLFDEEYGNENQQLICILFLDGNEKEHKAVESNVENFRVSWKRPKWHVWVQGAKVN